MNRPVRPTFRANRPTSRPNPGPGSRQAPGPPPSLADNVTWQREISPRELYRIQYRDRNDETSTRDIELLRLGHTSFGRSTIAYLGVMHQGRFKTLRADRVLAVETLSSGHPPSLHPWPTYAMQLPAFPVAAAVFRMPSTVGARTWAVDLNAYTCTCPEKRERRGRGYDLGQLGAICPHIARAIKDHLPPTANWPPQLLKFLADPRRTHLDNLI